MLKKKLYENMKKHCKDKGIFSWGCHIRQFYAQCFSQEGVFHVNQNMNGPCCEEQCTTCNAFVVSLRMGLQTLQNQKIIVFKKKDNGGLDIYVRSVSVLLSIKPYEDTNAVFDTNPLKHQEKKQQKICLNLKKTLCK